MNVGNELYVYGHGHRWYGFVWCFKQGKVLANIYCGYGLAQ